MSMARKEFSGLFLSTEKFSSGVAELSLPDCLVQHVRLFHNEPAHTLRLVDALLSGNRSVQHLEIYEVDGGEGIKALCSLLSHPDTRCKPTTLTVQSMHGTAITSQLGDALANPNCSIQEINFSGLSDIELASVLTPLAQTACSSQARRVVKMTLTRCTIGISTSTICGPALSNLLQLTLSECATQDAALAQLLGSAFLHPEDKDTPQQNSVSDGGGMMTPCPRTSLQRSLPTLSSLRIHGANIGVHVAQVISTLLTTQGTVLATFEVTNSAAFNDAAVTCLAQGLQHNSSLESLNLSHCSIGAAGAQALAGALKNHTRLRTLNLDYNTIGAAGFAAIMESLSVAGSQSGHTTHSGEHHMDTTEDTSLQQQGCSSVAHQVNNDVSDSVGGSGLVRLQLEGNWIKGVEIPTSLSSRRICAPVAVLNLGHNHMSDVGAQVLQALLGNVCTLEHLDLTSNGIGSTGALAIVQLIQQQTQLKDLILSQNRLHDAGVTTILDAARHHPSLRLLRAEACRLLDMELKTRLSETSQALAARARASSGSLDLQPRQNIKQGTRFAPEVYQVPGAGTVAPSLSVDNGHQEAQGAAPAPVRSIRMGSRFGPEAYALHFSSDLDSPKNDINTHQDGADMPSSSVGGDSPGKRKSVSTTSATVASPFISAGGGSSLPASGRGSTDMHWAVDHTGGLSPASSISLPTSPFCHATLQSSFSVHQQQVSCGVGHHDMQHMLNSPGGSQGNQGGSLSQQYTTYFVARPVAKRRSYKPLTPQQQAIFNVF